ncbi:unnamed protein product [Hymenolepis diminuta]|uniref:YTH domain-containing protein n=1 Tax=Hymenolepis diminuta TaxID=6216 RepID=A0A564XZC5_HYMDI|nr:unnamed protein product [Hymenolepis diminuta]
MMSSIPYDASAVAAGTVNPANQNNVIPLNLAAGVNPGTAPAYMRSSLTPQQQAQISVSPDASLMYQYVSPPLSSSSSPYATTSRDRITQQPVAATALTNPFLDYAAATGQLSYYCPQYLQYSLPTAADATYQQQAQAQAQPVQALDPSILGAYQLSSPPPQPLMPGQPSEGTTLIPQLLANVNTPTTPAVNTCSSRSTPAGAPGCLSAGVSSSQTGGNGNNSQQQRKRRLSSPLVLQQQHAQQSSRQQQDQQQQVGGEAVPTAASAPPVYGAGGISDASLPPASSQGRFVDMEGGINGSNGGYYPSGLLTSDQQRQQLQQFYAAAAAVANCYPLDLQQFYATAPRIAPADPYWTAAMASRHPLTWYPSSRGHPTPPPQTGRDDVQQQQQECYYSDLAATLHNMRLSGSGQGSGVSSERGTYSPIQYAGGWAYPTASPSSHTSSSPFPTLCGPSVQQQQHHGGGGGRYGGGRQGGQQGHHPSSSAAMVTATALAAAAAAASRLNQQAEFDPKELANIVPGINPKELDSSLFLRTRYFVIKSNSTRHVMLSIQHGVWCSTLAGNDCLNRAYLSMQQPPPPKISAALPSSTSQNASEQSTEGSDSATNEGSNSPSQTLPERGRVLLFFSVNTSGCFCGVAEMTSPVDKAKQLDIWQDSRWRGAFSVRWIYAKNVPNRLLRHIQVESAENRAVTHLRDTNEILPASKGEEMLQIIHNN